MNRDISEIDNLASSLIIKQSSELPEELGKVTIIKKLQEPYSASARHLWRSVRIRIENGSYKRLLWVDYDCSDWKRYNIDELLKNESLQYKFPNELDVISGILFLLTVLCISFGNLILTFILGIITIFHILDSLNMICKK